jgi:sodium/potassium-transporting ATPase subunit alpha
MSTERSETAKSYNEALDEVIDAEAERSSVEISARFQAAKAKQAMELASKKAGVSKKYADKGSEDDDLRADLKMTEHQISLDELCAIYSIQDFERHTKTGLSTEQVKQLQETEGLNSLTPPYEKPWYVKLLETQKGFFNLLLWAGSILCFFGFGLNGSLDNLYLGIVLAAVVTITGIFEYFQEKKSDDLMNSFKNMLPPKVKVLRNGKLDTIDSDQVCRGDIIKIKAGDRIPADFRVISCSEDMKVEQAALTGEPDALSRSTECTDENPLETKNLCFFGTLCPQGKCEGIVVNIGDKTVMGRIKTIATQTENVQTPINREIERFVKIVSGVAVFLGVTFFIIGAIKNTDFITNLVFMIGIIVANVPEGLLATVTVCLSLTAQRMFYKNVLVKNLESVETLGSTSCICSDKTGTLTINKMTVANVCIDKKIFETKYCRTKDKMFEVLDDTSDSARRLIRCGTCCNNAAFPDSGKIAEKDDPSLNVKKGDRLEFRSAIVKGGVEDSQINWVTDGDASESAMIKFTQPKGMFDEAAKKIAENNGFKDAVGIEAARKAYPKIQTQGKQVRSWEIPFNSKNKYQVSVHRQPQDGNNAALLLMKGAPEKILNRCSHAWIDGKCVELTEEIVKEYNDLNLDLAKMGRRVLAFCEKKLDEKQYPSDWEGYTTDPPNFPIGNSKDDVDAQIASMSKRGEVSEEKKQSLRNSCGKLTYIGMMALIDPPRRQVPGAVKKCKSAGIKVVMVTGDHPATAHAIAKEVGIIWSKTSDEQEQYNLKHFGNKTGEKEEHNPVLADAIVIPGSTFTHLTESHIWDDYCAHPEIVFARTSPQQKLIIVENFQKRGHVVAVTGDGVNDAPALKKADIGVAMGIMGSAVSKDAADMILLDDNFASIVSGVEEGRLIFDNLKKSIAYTLSSNIPEISPFLAFITVNIPLPLSTILILCVDLGTDMVPAISMAWEKAEADIMQRKPRNAKTDHLVTNKLICFAYLQIGVVQATAGFYAWMTILSDYGYTPPVLPGLGAFDNWGKQMLYCKVKGGTLRDVSGNHYETDYNAMSEKDINQAFAAGYMFWDDDITLVGDKLKQIDGYKYGSITACHFPSKNFLGETATDPSGFKWFDETTYTSTSTYSSSKSVMTTNQILALRKLKYIPYLPFRSRMSPFFKIEWLDWDVLLAGPGLGVPGMGQSKNSALHFQSTPLGFYTIDKDSSTCDNEKTVYRTEQSWEALKDEENMMVAGRKILDTDKCYKSSRWYLPPLSNGTYTTFGDKSYSVIGTNTPGETQIVNKLHSWKGVDGKVRQNVASRMMQAEALSHAQCGGFICIIVVQWADLMICKTRWLSIRHQGMVNHVMNFGLLFETCLGACLCYLPGLGDVLGTRPLRFLHWTPGMPFCFLIFMYDETRKYCMRKSSKNIQRSNGSVEKVRGWLERNTYY